MLLPGLGPQERRDLVDPAAYPWSAVVRVQIPGVSRCTGFAVAPRLIVTAAHCLYGRRLGGMMPAPSVHVLSDYERGFYARHETARAYRVAAGFVPQAPGSWGVDAAVLMLATPVTAAVLALVPSYPGEAAMLGGYSQDFSEVILADTDCRVMGGADDLRRHALLRHSCEGTHGTSGAPLLVRTPQGGWAVAGMQVAVAGGEAGGVAVPADTLRALVRAK
jgi:protease YdgD